MGSPVAGTGSAITFGNQIEAVTYTVEAIKTLPVPVRIAATIGALAPPPSAGSCNLNMTGSVTVTVNPIPTVNTVSNQTLCHNASTTVMTFSGTVTGTVYNWTINTPSIGLAANGTGNMAAFTATNAGTSPVTATITVTPSFTNDGVTCTGTPKSFTITVNPTPAKPTVSANKPIEFCQGEAVTLTSSATTGNRWNPENQTSQSISVTASGTFSTQLTDANGCKSLPSEPITVTVYPLPTPFELSGAATSICQSPLTLTLSGSQSGVSYQLKRNNNNLGSPLQGTGSLLTFPGIHQAGTYTVSAASTLGNCSQEMNGAPLIQVLNMPTAFNLTGGGTSCSGAPLSINLSNSQIGVNYQLKRGNTPVGNPVPGTGNPIAFEAQNTAGTYSVTASIPCAELTMNNTVSVSALTAPANNFTVTGGGTSCGTPLPVGLSGSQTNVFYQLLRDNTPVGTPVHGTGNAISLGNHTIAGTYSVMATRAGQCPTPMATQTTINLITAPTTFKITGGGTACANGVPIGLSGSQSGVTYQLKRGTTLVSTLEGDGNPLAFPNQSGAGTYTVEANVAGNCTKSMNGNATVSAGGTLPNSYTMTGGGAFCNNAPVPLGLSDSQKGIYYQLQRDRGNGFVNVGTTVQGTGNAISLGNHSILGEYRVVVNSACLTEMTGRKSITACNTRIAAENGEGLTENGALAQVMPNPVVNILHLKVNEAKGQQVNVSLLDASGRMLLQRTFVPESNQHQEEFEVSPLVNGIYFLKVNTTDKQATLKVVKVQ